MSLQAIKSYARKSTSTCTPSTGCTCGCGECFTAAGCDCSQFSEALDRGGMMAALYASSASTRDLEEMCSVAEIESFAAESIDAFGLDAFVGRCPDAAEERENRSRWEAAQMAGDTWYHAPTVRGTRRAVVAPSLGQPGREAFIAEAKERMARGEFTSVGLGSTTQTFSSMGAALGHFRGAGL